MAAKGSLIVTGGTGYIGSHTIVELIQAMPGHEVICIDDLSNSSSTVIDRIEGITGVRVRFLQIDLCDRSTLMEALSGIEGIAGVIHFAAYKSVPESVAWPIKYYRNNIDSLLNILEAVRKFRIPNFIFSSSCSVYGNIDVLPVNEDTPLGKAESPYAYTKQVGERIVMDFVRSDPDVRAISLRYFNPVGAHSSGTIGEDPINPPTSLVPVITRTAAGRNKELVVHGNDYGTRDGSCIRDYVHVSDIAEAHVKAMRYALAGKAMGHMIFNLGTGKGVSVLEAIRAFEKVSGIQLPYRIGPRRDGDVAAIYSDTERSERVLGWRADRGLEEMMADAWAWEQYLVRETA